jgi:hypothetical protein
MSTLQNQKNTKQENINNIIQNLKIGNKYTEKRGITTSKYILVSFLIFDFRKYCIFYDYTIPEDMIYFEIEINEFINTKLSNFKINNSKYNLNINREIFNPMNIMYGLIDNFIGLTKISQLQFFHNFSNINMFRNEEPNEPIHIKTVEERNASSQYRKKLLNEYKKTIVSNRKNNGNVQKKNLFGNIVPNIIPIPNRSSNNYIPSRKNEKGISNNNKPLTTNQIKTLHRQNWNEESIQPHRNAATSLKSILKKNI